MVDDKIKEFLNLLFVKQGQVVRAPAARGLGGEVMCSPLFYTTVLL